MNEPYDIFFTGSTNPRECIMIGGIRGTEQAVYLEFRTPNIPMVETQTTVKNMPNVVPPVLTVVDARFSVTVR